MPAEVWSFWVGFGGPNTSKNKVFGSLGYSMDLRIFNYLPYPPVAGKFSQKRLLKNSICHSSSHASTNFLSFWPRFQAKEIEFNPTPPKTNMDTQNDGLEKVTPFKHGNCWYLC